MSARVEWRTSLVAAPPMNQLTIDEDAICVGAKPCKENVTLAFNDNAVPRGITHSECVAMQGRERELRERRKWALFR